VITIRCQCGEIFHAEEHYIGRAIKCLRCGQVLSIGATPPTPPDHGSTKSPTPTGPVMVFGRWLVNRWGIAALTLVAIVTTGVVLLFTRDQGQQQAVTPALISPPAEVVSGTVPEPLPLPVVPQSTPGPGFALESEATKAKPPVTRLKTGTNIRAPLGVSGRGTLQINNGTSYDAAATLLDEETGTVRRFVYIRARELTTLSAIAPCRCRLFFALGTDWDGLAEEFREDLSFSVFNDLLGFSESETEKGVQWATFSVTLHPVPEGKAKTTRLSKEEFERQLGKRHGRKGV
jgi:hypothetical protein